MFNSFFIVLFVVIKSAKKSLVENFPVSTTTLYGKTIFIHLFFTCVSLCAAFDSLSWSSLWLLLSADQARDSRQSGPCTATLSAVFVHPNLRVLSSQLNVVFAKHVCQHQTLFRFGFCRWCWSSCWAILTRHTRIEMMAFEVASYELEVNWQKTKVQALGSTEDEPSTITVQRQEVAVVEEFVYLGSLVHSTTLSSPDVHVAMPSLVTRVAIHNLDKISGELWVVEYT